METLNEPMLDAGQRKKLNDKLRIRRGQKHKKRLHILFDGTCKAFNGWEDVEGTWTLDTCEEYIEWCHITKLFPSCRHLPHRKTDKANLHHCRHRNFKERCIQVAQHVYRKPKVYRNEVNLSIARMVYAEEILKRIVYWTTLVYCGSTMIQHTTKDIPQERLFKDRALGRKISRNVQKDDHILWSATSSDDKLTGCSSHTRREIESNIKEKGLDNALNNNMLSNDASNNDIVTTPLITSFIEEGSHHHVDVDGGISGPLNGEGFSGRDMSPKALAYITHLETELESKNTQVLQCEEKIQTLETLLEEKDEMISILMNCLA